MAYASWPRRSAGFDDCQTLSLARWTIARIIRLALRASVRHADADPCWTQGAVASALGPKSRIGRSDVDQTDARNTKSGLPSRCRTGVGPERAARVRRRAEKFLDRFDPPTPSPDRLRQLRAVELLEGIATPAVRDVLSELAKGAAEAPLSREAAAAQERLRR